MDNSNQQIIDALQELTEFVNDGHEGYLRAAKEDEHLEHKDFYARMAQQRENFARELNTFIKSMGGSEETGTTLKGKLYRQWMDFKAAITGRNDASIVNSCLYGEEWAQKAYTEALAATNLPAQLKQTLERQREASLEAMKKLQEMASKA